MAKKIYSRIYVRKTCKLCDDSVFEKGLLDTFEPITITSTNYKNWRASPDIKTCTDCRSRHGKIYSVNEEIYPEPPLHINCRCDIKLMDAINAGGATKNRIDGADYWLKYFGELPEYYVSKSELIASGWSEGKKVSKFAPGKMYSKGVYNNSDGHLPEISGRIWYEADINYYEGKRNKHRILWSNDGLIFVTYDHYKTFYEIV